MAPFRNSPVVLAATLLAGAFVLPVVSRGQNQPLKCRRANVLCRMPSRPNRSPRARPARRPCTPSSFDPRTSLRRRIGFCLPMQSLPSPNMPDSQASSISRTTGITDRSSAPPFRIIFFCGTRATTAPATCRSFRFDSTEWRRPGAHRSHPQAWLLALFTGPY